MEGLGTDLRREGSPTDTSSAQRTAVSDELCDGKPNNPTGWVARPSQGCRRFACMLRSPDAFPSLIKIRIAPAVPALHLLRPTACLMRTGCSAEGQPHANNPSLQRTRLRHGSTGRSLSQALG